MSAQTNKPGTSFWENKKHIRILNIIGTIAFLFFAIKYGPVVYQNLQKPAKTVAQLDLPEPVRAEIKETARDIARHTGTPLQDLLPELESITTASTGENLPDRPDFTEDQTLERILSKLVALLDQADVLIAHHVEQIRARAKDAKLELDLSRIEQEIRSTLGELTDNDLQNSSPTAVKKMGMMPGLEKLAWLFQAEQEANAAAASNAPRARIAAILERLISTLLRERNRVRNPRAKAAIEAIILRIRNLGRLFDVTPPTVTVTFAPMKSVYGPMDLDPALGGAGIKVTMTARENLSGLNPASLVTIANVDRELFPLSTTITSNDPVSGTLSATAMIFSATIPDGQVNILSSIADQAGNVGQGSSASFVKDTTGPEIIISQPLDGDSVVGPTVRISVGWTDVSFIDLASVRILIDGSRQPSLEALKTSAGVDGSTILSFATHVLEIQVTDRAGNSSTSQSTFRVIDPATQLLRLEIIGDSTLLATPGRCTTDPLGVRVTDGTGSPKPNIPVRFEVTGGAIYPAQPLDHVTNAQGIASVRYLLPPAPGSNTVKASIALTSRNIGGSEASLVQNLPPPVIFTIEGRRTALTITSPEPGPGGLSLSEFPGSGLPHLITVHAFREDGQPLRGELVIPEAYTPEGDPVILGSVATVHPSRKITNESGDATFAIEIQNPIAAGSFVIRFRLTGFFDEDGEPVRSEPVLVTVGNPALRSVFIVSGQGQISYSAQQAPSELVAQTIVIGDGGGGGIGGVEEVQPLTEIIPTGTIRFTILAGTGSLQAGSLGTPLATAQDPGGNTVMILMATTAQGLASVHYTKGPENQPDLVGVSSGIGIPVEDVFVISNPEIRLVSNANPSSDSIIAHPFEDYINQGVSPQDIAFRIELKLPSNNALQPNCSILALNGCLEPENRASALGQLFFSNVAFSPGTVTPRYSTLLSVPRFLASKTLLAPGEIQPEMPDGFTALHIPANGGIQSSVNIGAFAGLSNLLQDGELDRPRQILTVGDVALFKVPEVTHESLKDMVFKFSVTRNGAKVALDPNKRGKNNTISVQFIEGRDEFDHAGTPQDPIKIQVAKDNSNRRAVIELEVTALQGDGSPVPNTQAISGKIFVAQAAPGIGGALPEEVKQDPLGKLTSGALYPAKDNFITDPNTQIRILDDRNQPDPNNTGRAKAQVESLMGTYFGSKKIEGVLGFTSLDIPGTEASTLVMPFVKQGETAMSRVFIVGTALYKAAEQADTDDLENIVKHELIHIRTGFALRKLIEGTDSPIALTENDTKLATTQQKAFNHLLGQITPAHQANVVARREYLKAARAFIIQLDEIYAYIQELNEAGRADSKVSLNASNVALKQLASYWVRVCKAVKEGITIDAGGDSVTLTLGGAVRADVIKFLQESYASFTDPFASGTRKAKAGEWTITQEMPQGDDPIIFSPKE